MDLARVSSCRLILPTAKPQARDRKVPLCEIVDVKPELVEIGLTDDWIGEMTDLVLEIYHRNLGMYNQVVENLLLKDLLGP
ncbi:hypothetical protein PsorP6_015751 [Peronosclerospora sorghi]|uniref:Uncharacterized protein n=1 Tax=Peronosclerospora sorghi TaxID=230839 RepID=A0ACC0WMS7_9STRA|nr:hypothetical protein PsorP6_015751 [Peronosclerospora sorghi]